MATCDPKNLTAQAACLESCIPAGMQVPVLISLFAQLAGVNQDPNFLMQQAKRYADCIPAGLQLPVLLFLACEIATGSGQCTQPAAPVLVSATRDTPSSAALAWTETVNPALDFLVEWGDGVNFPNSQSFLAGARSGEITGLDAINAVTVKLIARNSLTCVSPDSNPIKMFPI